MTRTTPWRWITLHLSHNFLTDARTFILTFHSALESALILSPVTPKSVLASGPEPKALLAPGHRLASAQNSLVACSGGELSIDAPHLTAPAQASLAAVRLRYPRLFALWASQRPALRSQTSNHGRVKTHGPLSVTATICSKWAEYDPSFATAVHLSDSTFVSGLPALTIGSIANTIPGFSRGLAPLRST